MTHPNIIWQFRCELIFKILDHKSASYVDWVERSETQPTYFSIS